VNNSVSPERLSVLYMVPQEICGISWCRSLYQWIWYCTALLQSWNWKSCRL